MEKRSDCSKLIRRLLLFVLFALALESAAAQAPIDHSFVFMDKWGLIIGYEIQFIIPDSDPLDNQKKEELFSTTKEIVWSYGKGKAVSEFYFKRDSIERKLIADILDKTKNHQIRIKEVSILNLMVPKEIADAFIQRATILKEPQPTRIKVLDK